MGTFPRFSRRIFFRKKLYGGKKTFVADRVKKAVTIKRVARLEGWPEVCAGRHGTVYDLLVYKGKHKVNLVIKKYRNPIRQNAIAKREFGIFQRLRANGFSVPPTIRLVQIYGKKYVALTDLSKLGDLQFKHGFNNNRHHLRALGIPEEEISRTIEHIASENQRARELGIKLEDSWELIVDTKNKNIKPFILDLGANSS
ncbi:MAG: hypothetical protein PHD95_03485 [Candidatus ainarchaeum sp.]|nr:hypothetical protein [Candidatus ainarchaeum sp.]